MRGLPLILALLLASPAAADQFVVDVSERQVAITAGFTGAERVVFGTTAGPNGVIIVVRGPDETAVVRRKDRIAGIWVNRDGVTFPEAPTFVRLSASKGLVAGSVAETLATYNIGRHLLAPEPAAGHGDADAFVEAFVRRKQASGLYPTAFGPVDFVGERLFRARIAFPANVPVGSYRIEVFEVLDGTVVNATAAALHVRKAGIEAAIFRFAHDFPILHGLVAIAVAMVAGWSAGSVARRS